MGLLSKKNNGMTDMTIGGPYRLILFFSIPLLIGNIFQQLYNMVDSIVVGNYIGETALAAVGTGFPIIFMTTSLFMGIGIGATIMISQYYGAKDMQRVNKTIGTIYTSMIIGVIPLSIVGVLISRPLLLLINVPPDTIDMATTYMVVIFIGMIGNFGFNINAGILQGLGDSKTSLIFLAIACIINIVLDILFAVVMSMGVFGVAFATIIAQFCSWIIGVVYINKVYTEISIKPLKFIFDKELFIQSVKLGIPSGIQQALFSIGIMVMQALVNNYGSNFMAGFNGANKLDTFAFMPIQSFASAVTTYVGQNIGANKMDRVVKGANAGLVVSVVFSIVIAILVFPFSHDMMKLFSQNPEVIDSGVAYLNEVLPLFFILAINFILNSVMRGAGEMIVPMISSFIGLWIARLPAAYLITHFWGPTYMFYSYPIGWSFGLIITVSYYLTGRWKNKALI